MRNDRFRKHKTTIYMYCIEGILYSIMILLNCEWDINRFIFVWNNLSWYLTANFLFLYPLECFMAKKLITQHKAMRRISRIKKSRQGTVIGYLPLWGGSMPLEMIENQRGLSFEQVVLSSVIVLGVLNGPFLLIISLFIDKIQNHMKLMKEIIKHS